MASSIFDHGLVWLSTQICKEDELDCLRFIGSSVLVNQFKAKAIHIFQSLQHQQFLSETDFAILYDALQYMGRIDLQKAFLKKICKQKPKQKSQLVSSFTIMLINVCKNIDPFKDRWETFLFMYKKKCPQINHNKSIYSTLQCLLDSNVLKNDKKTLKKCCEYLETVNLNKAKTYVEKYLNDNFTRSTHPGLTHHSSLAAVQSDENVDGEELSDSLSNLNSDFDLNEDPHSASASSEERASDCNSRRTEKKKLNKSGPKRHQNSKWEKKQKKKSKRKQISQDQENEDKWYFLSILIPVILVILSIVLYAIYHYFDINVCKLFTFSGQCTTSCVFLLILIFYGGWKWINNDELNFIQFCTIAYNICKDLINCFN